MYFLTGTPTKTLLSFCVLTLKTQNTMNTTPFQVSYYDLITDRNNPQKNRNTIDRFDIYHNIGNSTYSLQTSIVIDEHYNDILDGFKTKEKTSYQKTKRTNLNAFMPCGVIVGDIVRNLSGIVCLDVDSNPPEQLKQLKQKLPKKDASIEACALSVSGRINGSFFLNIRYFVPHNIHSLSNDIKTLIGIRENDTRSQAFKKYHEAFYRAISHRYTTKFGVILKPNVSIKQPRYLADDPAIYINSKAQPYTLKFLETFLKDEKERAKEFKTFEKRSIKIETSNAYDFAYQFAATKFTFEKGLGQRYLFINQFSICCNLLGVDERDCIDYVQKFLPYEKDLRDSISYPYKNYHRSFGKWRHKLKPKDIVFELKENQYFSDLTNDIVNLYKTEILKGNRPLFCFESGTGTGKTYGIVKHLAHTLKILTGEKTVFVCNLNLLTDQTAIEADTIPLTGKPSQKTLTEAFQKDIIVVNHNALRYLASYMLEKGIKCHFFIDESHTLVSSASYKPTIVANVLKCTNALASSIGLVSATPKDYFINIGYKRIKIKPNNLVPITIHKREITEKTENIVIQHIEDTNFDDGKIVMFKIQSKDKIERIKKCLLSLGYKQNEIVILYSDEQIKSNKAYKRIKKTKKGGESFDPSVKIVLVTSFINEGVNIYSKREIEFINIEEKLTFDYEDLYQFIARHRTDKSKVVYSYHKPCYIFDRDIDPQAHIVKFNKLYDFWFDEAYQLNTKIEQNDTEIQQEIIKTYSSLSNTQKNIHFNEFTQSFEVNVTAVMARAERDYIKSLDTNTAYKRLVDKFPHIQVIEDKKEAEIKPEIRKSIASQKKVDKDQKEKDRSNMTDLYKNQLFPFLVAFLESSENFGLIKKIISHFNEVNPNLAGFEDLQSKAFDIIKSNESLFGENINLIENFLYYICKLLDRNFERDEVLNILLDKKGKLRSPQKLTTIFNQLSIFTFLEADKYAQKHKDMKVFNRLQKKELKNYKTVISAIHKATNQNGMISKNKALMIVCKHLKGYTLKQASTFINTVFDVKYDKHKKSYLIKDISHFKDLFKTIKIPPKKYVERLYKSLIDNHLHGSIKQKH